MKNSNPAAGRCPFARILAAGLAGVCGALLACASLAAPPTISKSFNPTLIPLNGTTVLTVTLHNPNPFTIHNVSFTDAVPSGLSLAGTVVNGCGGTFAFKGGTAVFSGATLPANATCNISVPLEGTTPGAKNNTTSPVSSTETGAGAASNTATVTVVRPPVLGKSFASPTIALNGTTQLTLTVQNPNLNLNLPVSFTDTLPSGLVVASPNGAVGGCAGTVSAVENSSTISVTNGTVFRAGSCSLTVNVRATTPGTKDNTAGPLTYIVGLQQGTGNSATASLTAVTLAPPHISKEFIDPQVVATDVALRFTITNPGSNVLPLTGVSFTDVLSPGVSISNLAPTVSGDCYGTSVSAPAGGTTITMSGAMIPVGGQCSFDVKVFANAVGLYPNETSYVTSTNAGTGNRAIADFDVLYAPLFYKFFDGPLASLGGTSRLTLETRNWNLVPLSSVSISDVFPAGLEVANPPDLSNSCGGTVMGAVAASTALHLTGGTVAGVPCPNPPCPPWPFPGSCSISVSVKATQQTIPSNTATMDSANAGGAAASATLSVSWTSLSSSAEPAVYGQTVTFTATVNGAGANPGGTVSFSSDGMPLAPCTNVALAVGMAQCSTGALSVGVHSIGAQYSGTPSPYVPSSSAVITQQVNKAPTVTTLSSSANPSVYGQSLTFTATVTGGGGTPGGTVSFTRNGAPLPSCSDRPLVNGQALCFTGTLPVGPHTINANYSGTPALQPGTGTLNQQVNKANTTTTISELTPMPGTVQQATTVLVSVAAAMPGSGAPTGTVTVTFGPGGEQCSITLPFGNCSITPLSAGGKTVTAVYAGDSNFNGSTSPSLAYTVNPASGTPTVTTLSSSANPSVYGQSVTLAAIVTGGGVDPGGNVTFLSDGMPLASCANRPLVNGQAQCAATLLAVGPHSTEAQYSGTATLGPSVGTLSQQVDKADTATSIVDLAPNPGTVQQPTSVTVSLAAMAPGSGQPTGTVTITVAPSAEQCTLTLPAVSCTITPLSAGAKLLTATYNGDGNFNVSASSGSAYTVNSLGPTPTTTVVSSVNPASAVFGQPVMVSIAVTAANGILAPAGTVTVDGGSSGCVVTLTPSATTTATGSCALTPTLPPSSSSYTVTASYSGNAAFAASASSGAGNKSLSVTRALTAIAIGSHQPNPSNVNSSVTVAASLNVVPPGAGTPTGMITVASNDPGTDQCTIALPAQSCAMALSTSGLKSLTAQYHGDGNFEGSLSPSVAHTVGSGGVTPTTAAITLVQPQGTSNATAAATASFGQPVAVTVTVTADSGSLSPQGQVVVESGNSSCPATLVAQPGVVATATCTLAPATLPASATPYAVSVSYAGDSTFAASSARNGSLTIVKAPTTISIIDLSPLTTSTLESVAVTVRVESIPPGAGTPTGAIAVSDGVASCSIALPATKCNLFAVVPGTRTLIARYGGDGNFGNSVSSAVTHAVTAATQSPSLSTPTGTGSATIGVAGNGCSLATACFVDPMLLPRTGLPNNVSFPQGLANFAVGGCGDGNVKVTITYPQPLPSGTNYWKYGPTATNPSSHWYILPSTVVGNRVEVTIADGGPGDDDLTVNGIIRDPGGPGTPNGTVVEFYNAALDHYFITADPAEAASIDNGGSGPGWTRTGGTFSSGGGTAVCRFYGSLSPGPNSHFYTVDADECQQLKDIQAATPAAMKRWNFESYDFLSNKPANGSCPVDTVPIYRAYNDGFARGIDSNHRITSDPAAIQQVVARGWKGEGLVMCAPGPSGAGTAGGGGEPAVCGSSN